MMNWPAPGTAVTPVDGGDARSRSGSSMTVLEQLARTTQPRLSRRTLLSVGSLAGCSALWPGALRGEPVSAQGSSFGRARHCILLFLTGGPPQHDTWDPKPQATDAIRGETTAIETNVPGIRFGHLFPQMANCADRLCVVRSVTHSDTVHTSAGYTLLTGVPHPAPNNPMGAKTVGPSPEDHPHLGALLASVRPSRDGVPVFVSLPEVIKDAAVNEFPGQSAGFMGRRYDPLQIEYDAHSGRLQLQDLMPPAGVAATRLERRRALLDEFDLWRSHGDRAAALSEFDIFRERAFSLLSSRTVRAALDQEAEPADVRERYGSHLFGQGCLLARRLVEAGVSLVTVYWHYEGPDDSPVWDTHWNNFSHLRNRLAPPATRRSRRCSTISPGAVCSMRRWWSAAENSVVRRALTTWRVATTGPTCRRSCSPAPAFRQAACTELPTAKERILLTRRSPPPISQRPCCTCWASRPTCT